MERYPVDIEKLFQTLNLSIQKNVRPMIISLLKKHKFLYYKNGTFEGNPKWCKLVINDGILTFMITYDALKIFMQRYRKGYNYRYYFCLVDKMKVAYDQYVLEYLQINDASFALMSMNQ